ncbi:MAG: hypothetical protein ACLU9S_17570 [Oscillospiraceae bacterium]
MVKGISRQVIVVRSPDPKLFEQAIFILRENALGKDGMSDRAILRQAQQAAGSYVPSGKQRRHLCKAAHCGLLEARWSQVCCGY